MTRTRLCWASAALLSLLPHGGLLIADWGVRICAYPETEGGHAGLGLGFGVLATLLPFGLMVSAVVVRRVSYSKGRLLTWLAAGGAVMTAAYYALSVFAFFFPYCPSGSQGLLFVLLLYGGIAGLILIAGTSARRDQVTPERSGAQNAGGSGGVQEEQEEGGAEQGGAVPQR
ncbi:hypothetical protein ACTMTF_35635 [Nonomuraea sp. ZG12]|uniref:hypothetical protein n=1 Tax=Nonomuraea sp. ZG12 TaxID=3452207 RepID=UPI003F8AB01D